MVALSAVKAKVWLLYLQSSKRTLSFNVIREICSYIEGPYFFAAIRERTMEVYDFNTHKATQHQLPTNVWSGYIQVDRSTVLIVGLQVMTLDIFTLQITPQAPLPTHRGYVGLAKAGSTVFAFGGYHGGPRKVCDKNSVPLAGWNSLPPMHYARSHFTPCAFKALLYLTSTKARSHRTVETFSPNTETFTVLSVSLPAELQLGCSSVAFVANEELFLLTHKMEMACWRIECEFHFRVSSTARNLYSSHPPLVVGTEVYIAVASKVEKWTLPLILLSKPL